MSYKATAHRLAAAKHGYEYEIKQLKKRIMELEKENKKLKEVIIELEKIRKADKRGE